MNLLPKSSTEFSTTDYWNSFFKKRGKKSFDWYVKNRVIKIVNITIHLEVNLITCYLILSLWINRHAVLKLTKLY